MLILLTNDDGIEAAGLQALRDSAESAFPGCEIVTCAPGTPMSECGHAVTTHAPIRVEERGEGAFAVHGTPADCVRVALYGLDLKPDWVLSGINHGGNLGCDLYISGTAAAAREAAYHGVRSAAVSHYLRRGVPLDWKAAARRAAAALSEAIDHHDPLGEREFWSINLPHPDPGDPEPAVRLCPVSREPLPVAYTQEAGGFRYGGVYAERLREPGSDVDQCFGGAITLSRVPL